MKTSRLLTLYLCLSFLKLTACLPSETPKPASSASQTRVDRSGLSPQQKRLLNAVDRVLLLPQPLDSAYHIQLLSIGDQGANGTSLEILYQQQTGQFQITCFNQGVAGLPAQDMAEPVHHVEVPGVGHFELHPRPGQISSWLILNENPNQFSCNLLSTGLSTAAVTDIVKRLKPWPPGSKWPLN